jgi:hypothetical protein
MAYEQGAPAWAVRLVLFSGRLRSPELQGDNLMFQEFHLQANAIIWPWLFQKNLSLTVQNMGESRSYFQGQILAHQQNTLLLASEIFHMLYVLLILARRRFADWANVGAISLIQRYLAHMNPHTPKSTVGPLA